MPQWFSTFVEIVANWVESVVGTTVIGIAIVLAIAALLVIAWHRARQQVATDQQYRAELRKFVLAPVDEMNDALNRFEWDLTSRYNGSNKEALNGLCTLAFEHMIRVPYGNLARLVREEAGLPEIENALIRYMNCYRGAQHGILHNYMNLSGVKPDPVLRQNWLDSDERCFRALRELKSSPRASGLANLSETMTAANNGPWE